MYTDETEAHLDYEDKFPDGGNIYTDSEEGASLAPERGEEEEEEEEDEETQTEGGSEGADGETGEGDENGDKAEDVEEDGGETDEKESDDVTAGSVTDPPVSLLSQKHLFWFPSEAFHDDDEHVDTHTTDHKHSGATETDSVAEDSVEQEHYGDDHAEEPPTDEVQQHTDKSWLDGYPIDEEFTKSTEVGSEEEKEVGSEEKEEKEVKDVSKEDERVKSEEYEKAIDSSEEALQEVIEQPEAAEIHPTFFTNVSDVTTELPFLHSTMESLNGDLADLTTPSGVGPYDMTLDTTATTVIYGSTGTTPEFFHHASLPTTSDDVTAVPEDITSVSFHVTLSPEDVTADYDLGTPVLTTVLPDDITTLSTEVPVLIHDIGGADSDHHNLTKQSMPTEDPCELDACPSSRSSSLVAIVTVGTIVAVVGLALGAWLFRRRQRKSSHYQFNGTNSHTQNFEMQQTA